MPIPCALQNARRGQEQFLCDRLAFGVGRYRRVGNQIVGLRDRNKPARFGEHRRNHLPSAPGSAVVVDVGELLVLVGVLYEDLLGTLGVARVAGELVGKAQGPGIVRQAAMLRRDGHTVVGLTAVLGLCTSYRRADPAWTFAPGCAAFGDRSETHHRTRCHTPCRRS